MDSYFDLIPASIQRLFGRKEWQIAGFTSEAAYIRKTDDGVNNRAHTITDFYPGYPYVVQCPYHSKIGTTFVNAASFQDFDTTVAEWMKNNITNKYRIDFHRVFSHNGVDSFNDIGGLDNMYVAFIDEKDALWFSLSWC